MTFESDHVRVNTDRKSFLDEFNSYSFLAERKTVGDKKALVIVKVTLEIPEVTVFIPPVVEEEEVVEEEPEPEPEPANTTDSSNSTESSSETSNNTVSDSNSTDSDGTLSESSTDEDSGSSTSSSSSKPKKKQFKKKVNEDGVEVVEFDASFFADILKERAEETGSD